MNQYFSIKSKINGGSKNPGVQDIMKLAKAMKRHLDGIMGAIRSEMNSAVVKWLNNKIRTAFRRHLTSRHVNTGIR